MSFALRIISLVVQKRQFVDTTEIQKMHTALRTYNFLLNSHHKQTTT